MFSEKQGTKENSRLFTKYSCFCKCHLLHLFRKITFIIFQVRSLFALSVALFFSFPLKESTPILWCFLLFFLLVTLTEFFILPCGKQHKNYWSIDNSFNFIRHISLCLLWLERFFCKGRLLLFKISMALFELRFLPYKMSLLKGNE